MRDSLQDGESATSSSAVDFYMARPVTPHFESMTLPHFMQWYKMPKEQSTPPTLRLKSVVVVVRPYCCPDSESSKYDQYCRQKLMLHKPFRSVEELRDGRESYKTAYAVFLKSGSVPPSLEDDISRLDQNSRQSDQVVEADDVHEHCNASTAKTLDDWMIICQHESIAKAQLSSQACDFDWSKDVQLYSNLDEAATFMSRYREEAAVHHPAFTTKADPSKLQRKQHEAYSIVWHHHHDHHSKDGGPLRIIVSGTAGTGKSYLIHCLRLLLQDKVRVAAPTGVAAFNIDGHTLHSLLALPTKGDFKELEGKVLHQVQLAFRAVEYLIIDEMSMVGRKMFGQIDRRLRQVFPHHADDVLGGCSCLLFGDFGQLPPVMDLPLYISQPSRLPLSHVGRSAFLFFDRVVVLDQSMHQSGNDPSQVLFRDIMLRLRDGKVEVSDWEHLMRQTPAQVCDLHTFRSALRLFPTVESVLEYNMAQIRASGHPIAVVKAVHTGTSAPPMMLLDLSPRYVWPTRPA